MLVYNVYGDLKMDDFIFEWGENKGISNLEKHGFDFLKAIALFTDWARVHAMTFEDVEESIKDDPDMEGFWDIEKLKSMQDLNKSK